MRHMSMKIYTVAVFFRIAPRKIISKINLHTRTLRQFFSNASNSLFFSAT
jgi:hypothetical protein